MDTFDLQMMQNVYGKRHVAILVRESCKETDNHFVHCAVCGKEKLRKECNYMTHWYNPCPPRNLICNTCTTGIKNEQAKEFPWNRA